MHTLPSICGYCNIVKFCCKILSYIVELHHVKLAKQQNNNRNMPKHYFKNNKKKRVV